MKINVNSTNTCTGPS